MATPGRSPNREILEAVARRITPLLDEVVLVGGHMAELLVTHPAAVRPRVTDDVDVVVQVTTRAGYQKLGERLLALDLRHDTREDAPLCRWRTPEGFALDAIPMDEGVLGFTNRWYPTAVETAKEYTLAPGLVMRGATAPVFLATKWEAFQNRGQGDVFGSHDLEDIITVTTGRPEIVEEMGSAHESVRRWVAESTSAFLDSAFAGHAVEGALPDAAHLPGLVELVVDRLRAVAATQPLV